MATAASPIFSKAYDDDPVPVLSTLREQDPVHWLGEASSWLVTRYDLVLQLLTDPRATNDPSAWEHFQVPPEGSLRRWITENGFFSAPPAEHARMRRMVSAALTPRAVKRMEHQVLEVVEQFAEPLRGRRGIVELIGAYTGPIPNAVISRITGVPPRGDDDLEFQERARVSIRGSLPFTDDETRRQADDALEWLVDYVRELAERRRREPEEDLVSDLVQVHDMDDRMTNDEIVTLVAGLIGAGSETTAVASTQGIRTLLDNPDQLELLRADRSLLDGAVNELLRTSMGGGGGLPRYAIEDFDLEGKSIKRGQLLMLSFTGAHRDPRVFDDPDRIDIQRDNKELITFGRGPHFCLGANLARQELRRIYDGALDFLPPGARVLEDQCEWSGSALAFRRLETMPIDFGN